VSKTAKKQRHDY